MVSALERQREENLRRNRELLIQLGLDVPIFAAPAAPPPLRPPVKKTTAPQASSRPKRRIAELQDDDDEYRASPSPEQETVRVATVNPRGVRRSSRQAGKPRVNYREDAIPVANNRPQPQPPVPPSPAKRVRFDDNVQVISIEQDSREQDGEWYHRAKNRLGTRIHDPRTYGPIPGVSVGAWWETRAQCSTASIHAPWVSGISAGPQGAFSIALSGGYEDDVDLGAAFTFTGAGGRDLKGTPENRKNLRTAPQSKDQRWDTPLNAALKKSIETQNPVRVIRGYRLQSEWAPASGYRYDGLYRVEKAWMERGLNQGGFQVCKFALKRIDGQPPLPRRDPGAAPAVVQSSGDGDGADEYDELDGDVDEIGDDSAALGNELSPSKIISIKREATPVANLTDGACEGAEPVPSDSAGMPMELAAAEITGSVDRPLPSVSTAGNTEGTDTASKTNNPDTASLLDVATVDQTHVDVVPASNVAVAFDVFAASVHETRFADDTSSPILWPLATAPTEHLHVVDSGTTLQESEAWSDLVGLHATEPAPRDVREPAGLAAALSVEMNPIPDYTAAERARRPLDLLDAEVRGIAESVSSLQDSPPPCPMPW